LEWDGRDSSGNPVANGTYIVHLENSAGERSETRTFPIVKMR
jgi:flagellar hook assembly protein FlgD